MTVTAKDIQREHEAALASLTPEQRRAIDRLVKARRASHFNQRWPTENLKHLFEQEACARNSADQRRAA